MSLKGMRLTLPPLFLTLGCTAVFHAQPPTGDEVTIFVPGYKGTFLASDETGRRVWVNPGDVLSTGRKSIALSFEGQRPGATFGALHAEAPLTRLTVIPWVVDEDFYLSWMEYGTHELPGFVPFGYDWRQDIRTSAAQLAALIDRLASERAGHLRVNLIGHSMGGLVALYFLRYGSDPTGSTVTWAGARYVRRVVFAGSPFRGSPTAFADLQTGTATGLNKALLSRDALFTFPAVFELMPATDDFLVDPAGQPAATQPGDAATWCSSGWGVFADPSLCQDTLYLNHLRRMLADRHEFTSAIADTPVAPPPDLKALYIVGRGRPTPARLRAVSGKIDLQHPDLADGDGTVTATSAIPPAILPFDRFETHADHVALLNDAEVRAAVTAFIRR